MSTAVVHHARVAWDFAQQAVDAAGATADRFEWFQSQLGWVLGPDIEQELAGTRARLTGPRPDIRSVEIGRWRVRIEDILNRRSDLAAGIADLVGRARQQLSAG